MKDWFRRNYAWFLPIFVVALITPFTPWLDLSLSHHFYQGHGKFTENSFTYFWYNYGVLLAQILGLLSALIYLLSFVIKKLRPLRRPALVLILTMAIGAGFIVHTILKDHWGRPRPKQVIEFGGTQEYRPLWKPNFFLQPEPSKSFPCGHCTMGFYFFALIIVGKRLQKDYLIWLGILLSAVFGIALSYTRIAQGGHFFSDTLFTALVLWLTAYFCDQFVHLEKSKL